MAYTVFRLNHVHPDPSDGSEMSDRYRAALDMVEFLDQRGLNAVQFDEHHVSSTGWSPTPMMSAGMVLARPEHVLCMIGALLLPLHDPIRVAVDLAVLDLVGKGRIVVTMGLGYRPLEYTAMDKEWGRRGKIMDESLDVLLSAFPECDGLFEEQLVRCAWVGGKDSTDSRSAVADDLCRRLSDAGFSARPAL